MSTDPAGAAPLAEPDAHQPRAPGAASAAIINPVREEWEEPVSPRVILTFTLPDYRFLCRLANATGAPRYLWNCALQEGTWNGQAITLVAPAIGAPYAVAVLEKLIALGAAMVLALGWCGSLQAQAPIGAVILPEAAVSGDGTSRYYFPAEASHSPHPGCWPICNRLWSGPTCPFAGAGSGPRTPFTGKPWIWCGASRPKGSWGWKWSWRPCSRWAASARSRWRDYCWFPMNWPT